MADETRPQDLDPETPGHGVAEEGMEREAPRRAASAEFEVEGETGSAAQLRAAMDPANQSLREALRLSFRVLQIVIVGLVVVFIFSGVTKVDDGQSGVMLRFGAIVGEDGAQALEPGPVFSLLPYPAGEFVLFDDRERRVSVEREFWPEIRRDTFDQEVESARVTNLLRPGPTGADRSRGNGYVLTSEGDIAHVQLRATYEIPDPVRYALNVSNAIDPGQTTLPGDIAVKLATMRATVHAAARMPLETFTDFSEPEREAIRRNAQGMLDDLGLGVRISELTNPSEAVPALAIVKASRDLQETERLNDESFENQRQEAASLLISTAGENYQELIDLIDEYQRLDSQGDPAAAEALAAVDTALESTAKSGEIASVIERARSHRSIIESTLGQRYREYVALLPAYEKNPRFVIDRAWARTFAAILEPRDTEILRLPENGQAFTIRLQSSEEVARRRRDADLNREERRTVNEALGAFRTGQSASEMGRQLDGKAGRQLNADGTPFDQ